MPLELGMWRIDEGLSKLEYRPLDLESRLQDLLDHDIGIAAPHWMVIGREVRTSSDRQIDLLAMDKDGNLVVIELKRDQTPRDVVAQILEYGAWAVGLRDEDIASIFDLYVQQYHPDRGHQSLNDAFCDRFDVEEMPEELNSSHELVVVASALDPSTETVVRYLADEYGVRINAIFFRVFKDGEREYLTRAWLSDPTLEDIDRADSVSRDWNGEHYVSFGVSNNRSWDDAVKYGFISGGGGSWYTSTLRMLEAGARVWVNVPGRGYVGVGEVVSQVVRFNEFLVHREDGSEIPITDVPVEAPEMFDEEHGEHLVGVRWLHTVPVDEAVRERGFFGNQNTVARPRAPKWNNTVERLKRRFGLD